MVQLSSLRAKFLIFDIGETSIFLPLKILSFVLQHRILVLSAKFFYSIPIEM